MTTDLKTLVEQIEKTRKDQELYQIGTAIALGVGVLTLVVVFMPHPPKAAPVVEAPTQPVVDAYQDVRVAGKAAIVYDLVTGEILYAKNAQAQLPLASLTKLLTVYAGVTTLGRDSNVTITNKALAPEGDSGFVNGEVFSFSDMAKLALVASSNDAAAAIAETAETKRAVSADTLLAGAASSAGLSTTYALNGTGLDENGEISGGYGSAEDIAILAGTLLRTASDIARATTQPTITAQSLSGQTYTMKNTNPLVTRIPGLLLSKTGYTDLAGGNLAVIFDAGINHPVAVVVLGSTVEGRFSDVQNLIRATLSSFVTLPTL